RPRRFSACRNTRVYKSPPRGRPATAFRTTMDRRAQGALTSALSRRVGVESDVRHTDGSSVRARVGAHPVGDPTRTLHAMRRAFAHRVRSYTGRGGRSKNARALALVNAAVVATSSPRAAATAAQTCARYIGSLRRCEGFGLRSRGSR